MKQAPILFAVLFGFSPFGFADNLGADDRADTNPAGQDAVPTNDDRIINPNQDDQLTEDGRLKIDSDLPPRRAANPDAPVQVESAAAAEERVINELEANVDEGVSEVEASAVLIASLMPTEGNKAKGTVTFSASMDVQEVKVMIKVSGLKPNSKHAIHIHEFGDVSAADGTSAGGHFNPDGHEHGLPGEEVRHAGDLGNLEADADGIAVKMMEITNFTLMGLPNSIIGRSVVVHAAEDKGTQPTGDSGPRIAVGVIGVQSLTMPESVDAAGE